MARAFIAVGSNIELERNVTVDLRRLAEGVGIAAAEGTQRGASREQRRVGIVLGWGATGEQIHT